MDISNCYALLLFIIAVLFRNNCQQRKNNCVMVSLYFICLILLDCCFLVEYWYSSLMVSDTGTRSWDCEWRQSKIWSSVFAQLTADVLPRTRLLRLSDS